MILDDWKWVYSQLNKSVGKYPFYEGTFSYSDYETSKIARSIARQHVGWGRRAVEMRANKTRFDRFENDTIGLNEILDEYKVREAFDNLKEDILVCGIGFLALAGDKVMPFTALEATGVYDWYTQNLKSGVAVFRRSSTPSITDGPDSYMQFFSDKTIVCEDETLNEYDNRTGRPLMTMLTHKATTRQPFGRTVLVRSSRDALIDASRTVRQAIVAAYHYNTKVDILLGVDNETDVDVIKSQTGDILKITSNENGQIPQVAQFAQHAMAPFNDSLLMSARNFCADTKLSLNNLGLSSNAPQSPESLEIVGDDLREAIIEWQKEIGNQLKHFAMTLWMYKNNVTKIDDNLRQKLDAVLPVWLPIYRSDISKFGDGLNKVAQVAPGIVMQRSVWRNAGLSSNEIDQVITSIVDNLQNDSKTK